MQMKINQCIKHISAFMLMTISCTLSFAQDSVSNTAAVSAAKISGRKAEVGTPVHLSLEFNIPQPWCGLEIQWGDGNEDTVRVGHENHNKFPLQLTHTYQAPGQYLLKVIGKQIIRGLKSASSCEGLPKQTTITVESAQQKTEEERSSQAKEDANRRSRELAEKEADLRKREEKLERDRLSQDKREQVLKARQQAIENKSNSPTNTPPQSQPPAANKKLPIDPF